MGVVGLSYCTFKRIVFLPILFLATLLYGQDFNLKIPDSVTSLDYEALKERFNAAPDDSIGQIYALAYLKKAKVEVDSIKIARGFDFLSRLYEPELGIALADSVIRYTKTSNHENYPAVGYLLKGYYNYLLGNYESALENYLESYAFAKARNNITQQIEIHQFIAPLKNLWGNHDEALRIYREHLDLLTAQPDFKTNYRDDYLITLYNVALAYQRNEKIDSAAIFNDLGLRESLRLPDSLYYGDFLYTAGVNHYFQKEFGNAKDSLGKALSLVQDPSAVSGINYYLGQIAFNEDKPEVGIHKFRVVDSIYRATNDESPEIRTVYERLVTHFRKNEDQENELIYIRQLLKIDSALSRNREYLNQRITREYDTPELLAQQKILIQNLEKKNSTTSWFAWVSVSILLLGALVFYSRFRKNQIYKKLYLASINQNPIIDNPSPSSKNHVTDEITSVLLHRLSKFEENKEFTNPELSLSNLSRDLSSNSTYLSRIINEEKNKNYSRYINDLRIDYLLKRLAKETKIRNYTMQALGEEVGFKTAESFSNAFHNRAGIKPSYYIRKLKKNSQVK